MGLKQLLEDNPELASRYDKHPPKYDPKSDCSFCGGSGIKHHKKLNYDRFCICTYLQHDCCESLGRALGKHASEQLKLLRK